MLNPHGFAGDPKYILTKPIHPSQKLMCRNTEDGSCIFQIRVVVNVEMFSVFMSYGDGVRILSPASVVNKMTMRLRKAIEQYK